MIETMSETDTTLGSIRSEFERYRAIGERAMEQLDANELCTPPGGGLAISSIVWHIAGNLQSRFTDFLTTDGEKPWRDRDGEFEAREASKEELMARWSEGWATLFSAIDALGDEHLMDEVTIRGRSWSVVAALHRALAHISYHVGQIVYTAKGIRGDSWEWLTVPPGGTSAYNENPTLERRLR